MPNENPEDFDEEPPPPLLFKKPLKNKPESSSSTPGGPALCNFIAKHHAPYKNQALNLFLYVLLRHLALKQKENSQEYKRAEDALKEILTAEKLKAVPTEAIDNHNVPMERRILWQQLGMDPDSDNEVDEFFKKNNIDYLSPEQVSHETLEETAEHYASKKTPRLTPPTSTNPYGN